MVHNLSKDMEDLADLEGMGTLMDIVVGDVPLKQHWVGQGSALYRKLKEIFQPKTNQHLDLEPIQEESSDTSTHTHNDL